MKDETNKPEALIYAERLERDPNVNRPAIAAELRRQHAEIERLRADAERYQYVRRRVGIIQHRSGAPNSGAKWFEFELINMPRMQDIDGSPGDRFDREIDAAKEARNVG